MSGEKELSFHIKLSAKELWQFSMYHSYRAHLGIINLIFTGAALYLLITQWNSVGAAYRCLLLLCVLMFTVWQPGILFWKAKKQAKNPAVKEPMDLLFSQDGLKVVQMEQEAEFAWEHISRVVKWPTLYVLYMDRIHAYLIPRDQMEGREGELRSLLRDKLPGVRRKGV